MMISVPRLLALARTDPAASPLDLVMGERWGEIDLARSTRIGLLRAVRREEARTDGRRAIGAGGSRHPRVSFEALRRRPQAMVKMVRGGGVASAGAFADQMRYLSRDGEIALEASDRHLGAPIAIDEAADLATIWGVPVRATRDRDRTTHFVVSFPAGTDEGVAHRAGRAWADALFGSGRYGDVWDHYTAFHTDTPNPHCHVVVARRGIERGTWLKVSRRSPIDYDELRRVQVEVAAWEGIELEATPRLARAVHERPLSDVEAHRAKREGRAVRAPSHDSTSAMRAAAGTIAHARHVEADARLIAPHAPDVARVLQCVGRELRSGGAAVRATGAADASASITVHAVDLYSEWVAVRRARIRSDARHLERELATIPDGAARAPLEREAASILAGWAALLPEDAGLRRWARVADGSEFDRARVGPPVERHPRGLIRDADPPAVDASAKHEARLAPARTDRARRRERPSRSDGRERGGWDL